MLLVFRLPCLLATFAKCQLGAGVRAPMGKKLGTVDLTHNKLRSGAASSQRLA
jgi:hypothetical protein